MFNKNNSKEQIAGDNSTQIIVQGDMVMGISESQAIQICKKECEIALQNWTKEAESIAVQRINQFESIVLPMLKKHDEKLEIFRDPAFQILLRETQIEAACTDRNEDFVMLSELLLHLAEQKNDRHRNIGIEKAIKAVNKIDRQTLVALSLSFALCVYSPNTTNLEKALIVLNKCYGNIIDDMSLPTGTFWIENLELLSALRISSIRLSSNKFDSFLSNHMTSYFRCGLEDNSIELNSLKNEWKNVGLPISCFVKHPLKENRILLDLPENINDIVLKIKGHNIPLNEPQKNTLMKSFEIMNKTNMHDKEMRDNFLKKWNTFEHLKIVYEWCYSLPLHFSITPVGSVLASAYIHNVDPSLPCKY